VKEIEPYHMAVMMETVKRGSDDVLATLAENSTVEALAILGVAMERVLKLITKPEVRQQLLDGFVEQLQQMRSK
jgi:hypothetical protein